MRMAHEGRASTHDVAIEAASDMASDTTTRRQ